MRARTTGILAVMVVFLSSLLYISEQRQESGQPGQIDSRVFDLTTEPVNLIGIWLDDTWLEVTRKGKDWFLAAPIRARANALLVNRIVAALERLRSMDVITAEQRALRSLGLSDYGLETESRALFVEAGDRRETLLIGNQTPFGGGVYARKRDSDTVLILPEDFVDLIPVQRDTLRDRTLFQGTQRRITRIDIYRREAGFLQLVRQQDRWYLQQPVAWPADPAVVQDMLEQLFNARIQQYLWDAPVDAPEDQLAAAFRTESENGQLAADQARVRLSLWRDGGETGQEVFLGRAREAGEEAVFARRGGVPSVFTVSPDLLDLAMVGVDEIRSRRVWDLALQDVRKVRLVAREKRIVLEQQEAGSWQLLEPVRAPVWQEKVHAFWKAFAGMRVHSFEGPEQVAHEGDVLRIELWTGSGETPADTDPAYAISLQSRSGTNALWNAWMRNMDTSLVIEGFGSGHNEQELLNPAAYHSRRVLSMAPQSVVYVHRASENGSALVERRTGRDGESLWVCVEPAEGVADTNAVHGLLQRVERLEAQAVVAFHPADLEPYGLEHPLAAITFRFSDVDRIQQTLLLGARNAAGGPFAMLQGHGFVFRLKPQDHDVLTQAWLVENP